MTHEPGGAQVRAHPARTLSGLLRAHGLLLGCVGIFAGVIAVRLPREVGQDTWLSLLVGRSVARSGVPHHDVFTAWTVGQTWVDQQWLASLLSYGIYAAGGMVLLSFVQVLLLGGSVGAAVTVARLNGAAARTIAWLLVATIYPILLASGGVRTQSFALPLFVAVLTLLVRDVRRPGRTVLWTLPLLAVWANLHGSVVVGAGLVVIRSALALAEKVSRGRYLALGLGSIAAVAATPYGVGILGYYHSTLVNPDFRSIVTEWGAPTPSLTNAPLFLLAGGAVWLLARRTREIGRFGLASELALIVLTLGAVRSAVWLGLGSIVLLAPALDAELGGKELAVERMNRMVGLFGVAFLAIMLAATLGPGGASLTRAAYPPAAADAVARAATAHPQRTIYANERYADWLLFTHPELTGRVAFDARFELLSAEQLQSIFVWTNQITDRWRAAIAGSDVVVLDLPDEAPLQHSLLARGSGFRRTYGNEQLAVFVRSDR